MLTSDEIDDRRASSRASLEFRSRREQAQSPLRQQPPGAEVTLGVRSLPANWSESLVDPVIKALVEEHGVSVGLDVAVSIAGFSEDKVRELRRAGRFPGHRAGTRVMVFVPELVEWMRNGGEERYDPVPAPKLPQRRNRRRAADRPGWMDRVSPRSPA